MIETIRTFLNSQFSTKDPRRILMGVSGGADSIALLHLMRKAEVKTIAVCLDHQLRPDSADEVNFVQGFSESLGAEFFSEKLDVLDYSEKMKIGIEEAARILRYRKLFELAEEHGCSAVAVAHHADDQAETVLMHLLRGSGRPGLSGMAQVEYKHIWQSELPIIRPLLSVSKREIIDYLENENLNWIEDQSNQNPVYFRNRLRNEVIPYLENINPKIKKRLINTATVINEENRLIDQITAKEAEQVIEKAGDRWLLIKSNSFRSVHIAIQRRIILWLVQTLRPESRDFDFNAVENLRSFILKSKSGKLVTLPDKILGLAEYGRVYVFTEETQLPVTDFPQWNDIEVLLDNLDDSILMENGWELKYTAVSGDEVQQSAAHWNLIIHLKEDEQASIRRRQPGDRMRIDGMEQGSAKIKKLLINEKVPARYRNAYPIILVNDEIVWVPGLRKSMQCQKPFGNSKTYSLEWIPPKIINS